MYFAASQSGDNACKQNRGNCQHLCLAKSKTDYECKCAIGFYKDPNDNHKCIGYPEFVLYSVGFEIKGIPLFKPDTNYTSDSIKVNNCNFFFGFSFL